ncbi:MAG: SUMF1/EgtB/PvdO family nonheme iron enzyme [Ignavibacteria bacterium]|nr:SUMF1/EgtB/PvdO family nonheme iron enzyme [Ignavibacteria bacterium]
MKHIIVVSLFMLVILGCKKESVTEPIIPIKEEFVQVTGGTFLMGSTTEWSDELPAHSVTIGAFTIDKTEITYEKWTEVRDWGLTHGYSDLPTGRHGWGGTGINHPVSEVSWYDALKWCNARSEKDGLTPVYYTSNTLVTVYRTGQLDLASDAVRWSANGYRLPTEAEWEYAARGGTRSKGYLYSGSDNIDSVAWYYHNADVKTHPVSTKGANELGLYDLCGNVCEWCWDWYGSYSASSHTDPKGPTSGEYRVIRGGSFLYFYGGGCCATNRYLDVPVGFFNYLGFRCVRK